MTVQGRKEGSLTSFLHGEEDLADGSNWRGLNIPLQNVDC